MGNNLVFRYQPRNDDPKIVEEIIKSTGYFLDHEIPVAIELVEERLKIGLASEYFFVFAEENGRTVAYSCFGPIPCTLGSFDLYWIATHDNFRGRGIGAKVLAETESQVRELNGRRIYIETSSKPLYQPTQRFYYSNGYQLESTLLDFYDVNDNKLIYSKKIT